MQRLPRHSGFTLAELLVAVSILTLVMTAAYMAFSSGIRLWRLGEANLQTYQDARTSMAIMTRELQNFVPGAAHLFEGEDSEFVFYAVTPPMHPAEGSDAQVLWIRYRLRNDATQKGRTLVREERVVEDPLPSRPPEGGKIDRTRVRLGLRRSFDLANGVRDFSIEYLWQPPADLEQEADATQAGQPPVPVAFIVQDHLGEGDGMPQGIRLRLTLYDPNADDGDTTFTAFVNVNGPSTRLEEPMLGKTEVLKP
ncbi:MAG: hypothetical protein AMXMBFR84_38700 [Candidatus Hydrogenedentota bacterium]